MAVRTVLILFLSCSCLFGQTALYGPFTKFASSAGPIQSLNPTYWWVADDRSNVGNGNTITNWIDRIAGNTKTNASSLEPTYSSAGHGASFSGTTWFSNTTIFPTIPSLGVNTATFVVAFAPTTPSSSNVPLIGDDVSGGHGPLWTTSAGKVHSFSLGSGDIFSYATTVPYMYAGRITNGNNNLVSFTNNVIISVAALGIGQGNIKYVSAANGVAGGYKGTLIEEIWWIGTALTDNQITNTIYQYFRSQYPSIFP